MDRDTLIAEAEALLHDAQISDTERALWIDRFRDTTTDSIFFFVEMVKKDTELLPLATVNLVKKVDAQDDPEKMNALLEEERSILKTLFSN